MRVEYISGALIPSLTANSIHVMKMCQAFTQEGHQVRLTAPLLHDHLPSIDEKLWQHYGIKTPFPITWLAASPYLRGNDYQLRAVRTAQRADIELIYTRDLRVAAVASFLGVPVIYESHDLPQGKLGSLYFRGLLRSRSFCGLVVISQALRQLLLNAYPALLAGKSIVVAPDGVDLERFKNLPPAAEAKRQLGLPIERPIAGYTGHLYSGRGIELILELAQRLEEVYFFIVGGNGPAVDQWRAHATESGLNNIHFYGFVDNARLPLCQAACDLLLMPYQKCVSTSRGGDIAGFLSPMKMFEYMATGRPIISSNLPVLCEVLNEHNAVLCDPGDTDAWKAALELAFTNIERHRELGHRARCDVNQYTWRRRVQRIVNEIPLSDSIRR